MAALFTGSANAQTRILRIVTYNIAADTDGYTNARPGLVAPSGDPTNVLLGGVLEGIGEEIVAGDAAQAIDILALQETFSNSITVVPIVNALNSFYNSPGKYTNSTFQANSSGGVTSGGGPNALIYNTKTVQLLASAPVNPPPGTSLGSSSGEYRLVMRYQFAPAGVATNASNIFYIYVSHYKAGTGAANETARQGEAQIIRNNAATNLPPNSRILYTGDFNTGVAAEGMYLTLIASGTNQAVDPINPSGNTNLTWDSSTNSSSSLSTRTYSPTGIHYRDDYEMMTTNVYYGSGSGLKLISGTYHVFGNNGSIGYLSQVTASTNTALNNRLATNGPVFIPAGLLYTNLTYASDHLPVVADYTIPIPAPRVTSLSLVAGTNLTFTVTNGITNAVYTVLMSTNMASPFTNWIAVATNTATSGNFAFTATNAVNTSAPRRFFILQTK